MKIKTLSFILITLPLLSCANKKEHVCDLDMDTIPNTGLAPPAIFFEYDRTFIQENITSSNNMDVQVFDFNNDGYLDLVIAVEGPRNMYLENQAGTSFLDKSANVFNALPVGDSEDIVLFDFNNDGLLDLYFANEDSFKDEFYIREGDLFINSSSLLSNGEKSNAVVAFDYNGDDYLDLYLGNDGTNSILINNQGAGFTLLKEGDLCASSATTQDIELADLNGDGHLDIINANEEENELFLWVNGRYVKQSKELFPASIEYESREVRSLDIDDDGDLDLYFCNVRFTKGLIYHNQIFINNGMGQFSDATSVWFENIRNEYNTVDVEMVDLNGDNFPDLVLANAFSGGIQAHLNTGIQFENVTRQVIDDIVLYQSSVDLEVADFNNDGLEDIYITGFQMEDLLLKGKPIK